MSSVNIAGSRLLAPYTVVVDFTTRCCSPGAFWQAARSCIVPMTLSSFIVVRPPALPGVEITLMWTTVSTSSFAMTFAMTGLRMSARTKETSPMSPRGGTASTPMTRSMDGSPVAARAKRRPMSREIPVTSTTRPMVEGCYLPSLRRCTRVFLSSLRCFFLAMRLRRFLMTEPTNQTFPCDRRSSAGPAHPTCRVRAAWNRVGPVDLRRGRALSAGVVEALAQVLVDVVLADPEGAADADGGQLTAVHEPVDGHLRDAHPGRDLGDGQELRLGHVARGVLSHGCAPILLRGDGAGFRTGVTGVPLSLTIGLA